MGKAEWVKLSTDSDSVTVSADEHTGREQRETYITFVAAGADDVVRKVIQLGKPLNVGWNQDKINTAQEGIIQIFGKSNASALSFSVGAGDLAITINNTYDVNGTQVINNQFIPGDPGASSEYSFGVEVRVPAVAPGESKTAQVVVATDNYTKAVCKITASGDGVYLIVEEGDIELNYKGNPVSVSVESNTSWSVS